MLENWLFSLYTLVCSACGLNNNRVSTLCEDKGKIGASL